MNSPSFSSCREVWSSEVRKCCPGFASVNCALKEKGNFRNALKMFRFFSFENECSHVVRAGVTHHDHTAGAVRRCSLRCRERPGPFPKLPLPWARGSSMEAG